MRTVLPFLLTIVFTFVPTIHAQTTGDFDETISVTFDNVEIERDFKVHVPASYDGTAMPLLFMFHNVGDTAANAITQTDWNTTADANGFIVIYPQALNVGAGANWDISAAPIDALTQDTQFVLDMVDWASANYIIRQTRIFTTGLGTGGTYAYLAATQHSKITVFGCQSANASSGAGWFWPSSGKPELSAYIMCAPTETDLYAQSQLLRNHINTINAPGRWAHLQDSGEGYGWKTWLNQYQWDYFMPAAVDNAPTAVASAPANGTLTVNFAGSNSTDDDGYIAGYLWDFGDGGTSIEADPSYTFASSGITNVTLTVTDSKGQTDSTTINVAPGLSNTPAQITTPANADATELTLMADTTVHVAARDTDGDTLQYAWSQVDGGPGSATFETGDAADSIVGLSETGTYNLRVTVSDGNGGEVTSDVTITVGAPASNSYTTYLYVDGYLRKFIVYVPQSYDGNTDYPLLFMFHGMGGSAENDASNEALDWQSTADANGFIVIFPESLSWPEYWYWNPDWYKHWLVEESPENNTDVKFFDEMVAWSQANYAIKSSHIFTTGGSFGAFFSNYIAVARPNTIAAFACSASGMSAAGWPNPDPDPAAPLTWPIEMPTSPPQLKGILLHDPDDGIIPYSQSTDMQAEMLANGHICELITLVEMGHGWDKTYNQSQWNFFMNAAIGTGGEGEGEGEGEPQPALRVEPISLSLSSDAGTFEIGVTNAGEGVLDWNAEIVLGESWLSLDAVKVQGDGTLRGSYATNDLFVERVGTLRVTAIGALGSPRDITITQAAAAAVISATPGLVDFGAVDFGSSATGSATVTNNGDATLEGVAATSLPFAIESGEAYTLLPGESHPVVVRFTPIGNGAVAGALRFSGGGGAVVELVAEGINGIPDSDISVTPAQIDFGALEVGLSATETLTITNEGQIVLEGAASTSPPYSIVSGQTYAIFPGASHQVGVRFTPTESGTATGSLSLSGGGGATVQLLGTGLAEDEPALSLCDASGLLQSEFDAFKDQFSISEIDLDEDGFPEFYALALVKATCSLDASFELGPATAAAFGINSMALESEEQIAELIEYKHALAALMLIGQDTQAAIRSILSANGIELSGSYEAVTGIDGVYMPSAIPGKSLEEGYLVFDSVLKSENEPYSASGDFDGDGASNLDEYIDVIVNAGGSLEDFIDAATGAEGGEGEGEGEGPPPVCGALWIDGAPISSGLGDVVLLTLVIGAMLFLRRRSGIELDRHVLSRELGNR